jgi:hypothetical protein
VAERRETLKTTVRMCIKCRDIKSVGEHFLVKTGRKDAENVCKACYSIGYGGSKTYRTKRRAEDLHGYLKRNASALRDWRERNSEHSKDYSKRYNKSAQCKWSYYLGRAKDKGVYIDLAHKQEIMNLFLASCSYCARPTDDSFINGLDRIDNTKGYAIDNIVGCCPSCNIMKGTMSVEDFLVTAGDIADFHREPNMQLPYPISNMNNGSNTTKFKNVSMAKISKEEIGDHCYLCNVHRTETPNNHMGIDRINSDMDYDVTENLKPCCSRCNYAKCDYNLDEFIAHCHRIVIRTKDIMDELDQVTSKQSVAGQSNQVLLPRRKNNQYVAHPRAKPVLIRDPSKDNLIVAAYPSRVEANVDLEKTCIDANIARKHLLYGKFVVEECTQDVYESLTITTDLYEEFKDTVAKRPRIV